MTLDKFGFYTAFEGARWYEEISQAQTRNSSFRAHAHTCDLRKRKLDDRVKWLSAGETHIKLEGHKS